MSTCSLHALFALCCFLALALAAAAVLLPLRAERCAAVQTLRCAALQIRQLLLQGPRMRVHFTSLVGVSLSLASLPQFWAWTLC
eukprot:s4180_g3.t1